MEGATCCAFWSFVSFFDLKVPFVLQIDFLFSEQRKTFAGFGCFSSLFVFLFKDSILRNIWEFDALLTGKLWEFNFFLINSTTKVPFSDSLKFQSQIEFNLIQFHVFFTVSCILIWNSLETTTQRPTARFSSFFINFSRFLLFLDEIKR